MMPCLIISKILLDQSSILLDNVFIITKSVLPRTSKNKGDKVMTIKQVIVKRRETILKRAVDAALNSDLKTAIRLFKMNYGAEYGPKRVSSMCNLIELSYKNELERRMILEEVA